ncbi:NADPH-dependent oxidoreductase [Marinilactibacillus sp. 15R]|uniref:NAD(P)H-dependent FMN reductase n=1 Tax=Marinilactibacillus piezotolerans TaxID=258723 RepID=A0A1I3UVD5_9LACT|nr:MULTISPECIES: NAD(P)H-dependent oxidoreductase [Marinilactibacillus]API89310.1 NADPH-dependent oxidoreductase [Marinilactibacillus sp. 15R]SFJ87304.1 NAD(P)H-dependent FMN reductase [Marinilactibacillus piezotolerans]
MKIGIITGSIRENRVNLDVAEWVKKLAINRQDNDDVEYEIIDIKQFNLPVFAEPTSPAYTDELIEKEKQLPWSQKMTDQDGYIFIAPEYNHGIPSALKNALDFLYHELNDKAAGIVSYGSSGGVRSAEQLRSVLSEFQVAHVRTNPALSIFYDFDYPNLNPSSAQKEAVEIMIDQLIPWTEAMIEVRNKKSANS